jgi:PhnB protein
MQLSIHLGFNGQCRDAFNFYEKVLGGKIQNIMTWGESPMAEQVPKSEHDKIIHATLLVGDSVLMGGDSPSEQYRQPQGVAIAVPVKKADAERIFNALKDGGSVQMPLQKTFWSDAFGMVTYRYGIPWMINAEQEGQASTA